MIDRNTAERDRRYNNVEGTDHCAWCCNDGMVVHATRPATKRMIVEDEHGERIPVEVKIDAPGFDEMAPCPFCARGFDFEFPVEGRPAWPGGFWQGRPLDRLVKTCRCREAPMRRKDALEWLSSVRQHMFDPVEEPPPPPVKRVDRANEETLL